MADWQLDDYAFCQLRSGISNRSNSSNVPSRLGSIHLATTLDLLRDRSSIDGDCGIWQPFLTYDRYNLRRMDGS